MSRHLLPKMPISVRAHYGQRINSRRRHIARRARLVLDAHHAREQRLELAVFLTKKLVYRHCYSGRLLLFAPGVGTSMYTRRRNSPVALCSLPIISSSFIASLELWLLTLDARNAITNSISVS